MKSISSLFLTITLVCGLAACGQKPPQHAEGDAPAKEEGGEHGGHDDHGEEAEGAKYAEGKGISLMEETKKAIGLKLVEAEERKLTPVVTIEAQIYRAAAEPTRVNGEQTGSAYAAALLPPPLADAAPRPLSA